MIGECVLCKDFGAPHEGVCPRIRTRGALVAEINDLRQRLEAAERLAIDARIETGELRLVLETTEVHAGRFKARAEAAEIYIRRTGSEHVNLQYALDLAREELDALRAGDKGLLVDRCNALEELRKRQQVTIERLVEAGYALVTAVNGHGAPCLGCRDALATWRKAVEESTVNVRDGG